MTLLDLKRKLRQLERRARQRLSRKKFRPLTSETAEIIRRELLYGEPPRHFTPEQVRAFTEMIVRDLPKPPEGWHRHD